ncbi:unnamed protein product [Mycena citricolor]|uniref:non-specific serine/threonine protein kinase n=1 Tax=Mycena citricolor TaxID=2018698 RepID=A0AAD2GVE1_9AGAR|nr:unnamed protein product [Mycena citricolor]
MPSAITSPTKFSTVSDPRRKPRTPLTQADFIFIDGDIPTDPNTMENATRRPPVRLNAQDGPWSVSVAENADEPRSYSLYIKTPTHNLTLTRTAVELVELDRKLREAYPTAQLPDLPIDALAPTKRKGRSAFLSTLSRLASPSSNRASRASSSTRRATNGTSPANTTPQAEASDPFLSFGPSDGPTTPELPVSGTSTAVAAYLTTISNTPAMRQARVWKRFVRVRTDDLESVRVERAIKRVRSDLASHTGGKMRGMEKENVKVEKVIAEVEPSLHEEVEPSPEKQPVLAGDVAATAEEDATVESQPNADETASTKASSKETASITEPTRIHRSHSADPDKSSRISRIYDDQTDVEEQTSSQAEDDSSVSTTGHTAPKKRSSKKKIRSEPRKSTRKVAIDDFEMMRVLGKGCAGKVLLVRHKTTTDLYALKAITKRHVLAHQELQHTLTEQAVLKRMAAENRDPFVVKLWWSFHDKENLFLVMDFHPGGDLATQLARWGRLGRDRARFYAAEIVEGVEGLHAAGVIYRDLKPENILIGGDGHIVLTDFGLSKEFPRRLASATAPATPTGSRGEFVTAANGSSLPATPPWMRPDKDGELAAGWPGQPVGQAADTTTTFCGTAEYLAPEVIQGLSYSYEVDWWSFGTMLYEMLTGITPFWANNHSDMYVRVLQDELQFPDDRAIDQDTKSLIRGLLQRNPALRICEPRIKRHPYFSMIDWSHVYYKRYIPPYIPPIDPSNASDTQNFDDTFLDMEPVLDDINDDVDTDQEPQTDPEPTDGEESNTTPSQSRSSSIHPPINAGTPEEDTVDVFDGYSFKGRHSVLMDDDDDDSDGSAEDGSDEEEDEDSSILKDLGMELDTPTVELDVPEPKTPEARPVVPSEPVPELPSEPAVVEEEPRAEEPVPEPVEPVEPAPSESKDTQPPPPPPPPVPEKEPEVLAKPVKSVPVRATRARREKSGVPALDRHLDEEATEKEEEEDDDEDDDWDFIDAVDGEDRNGAKGTSLFARGVVDKYRLAVFRKASTPGPRSVSGMSQQTSEAGDSPSPSQRRGRTGAGLTFRKNPRQFLRPKSPAPPSSFSSMTSTAKSLSASNSATLSASSSSGGLLTPSGSTPLHESPSLRSKESAMSMGAMSTSSGENGVHGSPVTVEVKNKKLKKYKENAEKVFSFLSSPR